MARIRPQTGFETVLSSGISAVATTIGVTTAPTETSGYLVIEPGTANKEIIKYSGVSGTNLTGVSRGVALIGSSDAAGTGKAHAAGVSISMTNVHHYMEQLAAKADANTFTAEQTFETANINIGDGSTDEDEKITAYNGDVAKPFLMYDSSENAWVFSDDGTNTTKMVTGGGGLTAGTDIVINASAISLATTITQDLTFTGKTIGINTITLKAGETISGATLPVAVYQNTSDNEIYACDGNDTSKLQFIGFAISNGTDGNDIDVQLNGIVGGFTGLTEGVLYYIQDDKTIGTAQGTYNVSVGIAVSETQIFIYKKKTFGTPLTIASDTSYLANTDGIVTAYPISTNNGTSNFIGYTDSSNPPTTAVAAAAGTTNLMMGITFPVKKGNYYKVVDSSSNQTRVMRFTPLN